jgi:hypothetical protein
MHSEPEYPGEGATESLRVCFDFTYFHPRKLIFEAGILARNDMGLPLRVPTKLTLGVSEIPLRWKKSHLNRRGGGLGRVSTDLTGRTVQADRFRALS